MGIVRWVRLKLTTPEPISMGSRMSRRTFLGLVGAGAAVAAGSYVLRNTDIVTPPAITSAHEVESVLPLKRLHLEDGKLLGLTQSRIQQSILEGLDKKEVKIGGYFLIKSNTKVVEKSSFSDFGDLQNNIWDALVGSGYMDRNGKTSAKFDGIRENFSLGGMPLDNQAVDKVFNILQKSHEIYYIHSPTQFGQIVSEGMGYWMKILTNAARRLDLGSVSKDSFSEFGELQEHIWNALVERKYIRKYIDENGNENGRILINFDGTKDNFGLNMPLNDKAREKAFVILQRSFSKKNRDVLVEYQAVFNGLLLGTIEMINDNPSGLPGWRCYYNPGKFVSKTDFSSFGKLQNHIWEALIKAGYLNADGRILDKFDSKQENFSLNMPLQDKVMRRVFAVLEKSPVVKNIEFRSEQERASATDADLYIADALMDAELLAKEGIFESAPAFQYSGRKLDYTGLTNHMLSRIRAYDVEEMNGRHILRVSDMWGSRDFKGALTYNPSYARLAVLFRIAQRDVDRDFWLKLRHDSFELIAASHQFASQRYQEMLDSAQVSADGKWVRLDGPEAHLLESLMFKLSPLINDKLPKEYAAKGLEYSVEGHLAFVEGKSVRANLDGSRDISKETFEFIRDEIDAAGANLFFPDQVEVEVNDSGEYLLRPEIGAQNLDFTEGYDAIRIYAELGEDLLMNNDSLDNRVPEEYRISSKERDLLKNVLDKKAQDPKLVRAGRYHNAVALSAYFMARAGLATYKEGEIHSFDKFRDELEVYIGPIQGGGQTDIFDFINQQAKRGPQYYNASLALKILTSFLARDTEYSAQAVPLEKVSRVPAERDIQDENPLAPVYTGAHEDLDYLLRTTATDFKRPAEYLTQDIPDVNREVRGTPPGNPIFTVEAERRYFHAKDNMMVDSPKSQYEFGKACLSVGRYREAAQVYFELLKTAPSPDKPIDELIITESIRRLSDILRTINFPQPQIEDLFEWLLKREKPGKKTAYLRLAYIRELNQSRRITRALGQEKLLLDEIAKYFLPHSAWDTFAVDVQEVMLAGDNGHNPLPTQEFLASAWVEMIFSYANTYEIEHFIEMKHFSVIRDSKGNSLETQICAALLNDGYINENGRLQPKAFSVTGDNFKLRIPLSSAQKDEVFIILQLNKFPRKIYNREDALSLARLALGEEAFDPSAQQGSTLKLFADHIKALRSSLSGDLKGRLQLAQARIYQNAAYQIEEEMQGRLAFSLLWRNHFYDRTQPVEVAEARKLEMVREYEKAVKSLDEALPYFDQALRSESSGAANPTRLAEMLDGALSAYEFKIRLLAFRLRANEARYAFNKAYKRGVEIPDTTEKVQDKVRPILQKFMPLVRKQRTKTPLTSVENNLLNKYQALVYVTYRIIPLFEIKRGGGKLTNSEQELCSEFEEFEKIYFAATEFIPLTDDEQKLLSVFDELVEIYFRYRGRIKPVSEVMRSTAKQILDAFKDPLEVKISEAVRWGLLPDTEKQAIQQIVNPDTEKQAIQQIVNSEESADPRNVMWGLWARRLTNLYHGLGANIQDKSFLDEALDEALIIPDIWMSNPALRALTMVENTLKMTEILHDYRNLPDLVSQTRAMESWGSEMRTLLEVLIEDPAHPVKLPADLSDKVQNYINTIREHRESIIQVFETDPTLEAKILTNQANLIYWNADVEYRLAEDKYDKDQDGKPIITPEEKEILQQAKLADYENALTKYRLALQIDPHIIDSLNGSVQLSIEVKRDQDAFYFLMRTLRAMSGANVPPYKQREILSGINTLNEENEAREAQVATDQRLTADMRAALTKASKYMENLQEINVYHQQNLMEIFRAF